MRINLVIEFLGHNFMLGLGAGMEKVEPEHHIEVAELHSETQIAGFRRKEDRQDEDDDFEDRVVGFTRNVRTA